ncbi:hypothetical protein AZF37_08895 [endosymbiont 'TC1' of Trimyema compressum]|uniref:XdhC family protein n=1 Tax=endosymbiont 'TC1' of Trimyema compressum TaxID=243899 RepID=UPI0007F1528F|nr:XdhC/CoxI family protein [endosymbiont 'TC1' of Trimyema compressum]AMP21244.1 hypothetical protein AZF37_08895 [endosymbiont 'TC1' of Trimyema compressum]
MKGFYKELASLNGGKKSVALTGLSGQLKNKKGLYESNVWIASDFDSNTMNIIEEILPERKKSGLITVGNDLIYLEFIFPESEIIICGAGHVSIPIIKIGKLLGFKTIVIDDRLSFINEAKKAGADEVVCQTFNSALENIKGTPNSYFVIVTRGHRHDQLCLKTILQKENNYIGMIGSKRRVSIVFQELINNGVNPQSLEKVHSPIGLNIGAQTPEEIGLSVLSEIVAVKNQRVSGEGFTKELLKAINESDARKKVLGTIVFKKGSAPRGVGSKILIYEDGSIQGTIGGGCVESDVILKAIDYSKNNQSELLTLDLTAEASAEEGMVCGGVVKVWLEAINQ